MAGYSPLKITGFQSGLVQERENFLLPDDAYPVLQNAYVWRERILRKQGYQLLGRLQRSVTVNNALSADVLNLISALSLEATASIVPGSINVVVDGVTYTDPSANGVIISSATGMAHGAINYATGALQINSGGSATVTGTIQYYPGLPVMGIRTQELQNSENDATIVFDQKYAYIFNGTTYQEFIPGITWNAKGETVSGTSFFWSTNYWTSINPPFTTPTAPGQPANKLFWVTNNTGQFRQLGDPPRITDGVTWVSWWTAPATMQPWTQIDATTYLVNWLSMLPFRGRMVVFNTWEGTQPSTSQNFSNRIRWATIGNPFISYAPGPPATGSWRDDIRGQGGYLDIPTSEDIVSIGFVRDNLVIYCERSTWQLRYTGRSIAPFQIEKVNSELGGEGPFSAIQFDTSLVGIGDKGIVECDSYQSQRIDIKIPDLVFDFSGSNNAPFRVHGVRDFVNRLAFWTIPPASPAAIFPTQRLLYNYENDSWALFNDSLTTLGTHQVLPSDDRTWLDVNDPWIECDFPWIDKEPTAAPVIVGGNQQGFVEKLDELVANDESLYISNIVGHGIATIPVTGTATIVTSPNHNMQTGFVIGISGIPTGTPFDNLNGGIFGVVVDPSSDPVNSFQLFLYSPTSMEFSTPQLDVPGSAYIGGGLINIRENFSIQSKKFNFLDEGQSIQLGYLDMLMVATGADNPGAISMNVYLDYNDELVSNTVTQNELAGTDNPDLFFNSIIPTTPSTLNAKGGTKFWQRVYCPTRANFITLEFTFSNAQMAGIEQQLGVQIDAQVLWIRKAGRNTQI